MTKKTRGEIGTEVTEIQGAARRASSPVPRALDDMEELSLPGAREIATLTVIARSQDWQFEPLMKALEVASKIKDWSHSFMVAQHIKGDKFGPRFNWRDAPFKRYRDFKHFYQQELEPTWGKWEALQHTWSEVVKGRITESDARREIETRAQHAREVDDRDRENKAASKPGKRTDLRAAAAREIDARDQTQRPPQQPNLFDNNKNDVQEVKAPTGNATAAALRRLRKDAPAIHQRVLDGEITANAGMIEAGFRKKCESRKLTTLARIVKLLPKLSDDEREELRRLLE